MVSSTLSLLRRGRAGRASAAVGVALLVASGGAPAQAPTVDFEREVRPLLVRSCLPCHGFDAEARRADLRLDRREDAIAPRSRGRPPAIVPGDPGASALLERVRAADPERRMPPEGEPLTAAQAQRLADWIAAGAVYTRHWSQQPLRPVTPPPPAPGAPPPATAIDAFVEAELRAAGLAPAPAADRHTLLRRLHQDLTGLPPSYAEQRAFAADTDPSAYERRVDALLDSPRFAEHWARHWLDLVRYAETYGHEYDYPIPAASAYRDYVVRALELEVPYDQWVLEHLAGDLLPQPRLDPRDGSEQSIRGTGFWWLSQGTHGPVDVATDEAERIDNQLDVFGKAFLGTTVACARCHDHKFDPLLQGEYTALAGVLRSSRRQLAYLDRGGAIAAGAARLRELAAELQPALLRAASERAAAFEAELAVLLAAAPEVPAESLDCGTVLPPGAELADPDGYARWLRCGEAFGPAPLGVGEWRAPLEGWSVAERGGADSGAVSAALQGALLSPSFELEQPFLHVLARGRGTLRAVVDGYTLDEHNALLFEGLRRELDSPTWQVIVHDLRKYVGRRVHYEIHDESSSASIQVAWVRGAASRETQDVAALRPARADDPRRAAEVLRGGGDAGGAQLLQWALDAGLAPPTLPVELDLPALRARAAQLAAALPAPERVLAMAEGTPWDSPLQRRGDPHDLGAPEPRRLPQLFGGGAPFGGDSSGRLELARALLEEHNPYLARVQANRVWLHLLGRGLVSTPDDFGLLGAAPSHPQLLDYLAQRLRGELRWSTEALIREVVCSDVYRRAGGEPDRRTRELDPEGRLLARRTPRRLSAEALRDGLLAVSGRLDERRGGPSVPLYLTDLQQGRGRPAHSGPLDGDGRRSLYLEVRRNFPVPLLQVFDAPLPHSTHGARASSNVPAQSLALLNDPFVLAEVARLGTRLAGDGAADLGAAVEGAYRAVLARDPEPAEASLAAEFLVTQGAARAAAGAEGDGSAAALTDLVHVLVNSKEFLFVP
jgi:hypothetical protein